MATSLSELLAASLLILVAVQGCCAQQSDLVISQQQQQEDLVRELYSRLAKCLEEKQHLKLQIKELNYTVQALQVDANWTRNCEQQLNTPQIKEVVQAFSNNLNWAELKAGLDNLLDHNSEVYKQLNISGLLWQVGRDNYTQLASLLVCAGLPVDKIDRNGLALIHGAAFSGREQLVKMLVSRGSSVNLATTKNGTPLMYAAFNGRLSLVQWLVRAGADTTTKNFKGHNALHEAKFWNNREVAQYLQLLPH